MFSKDKQRAHVFSVWVSQDDKGNISAREEKALKLLAKALLDITDAQVDELELRGAMRELKDENDEKTQ